jgi:hypothetical protein
MKEYLMDAVDWVAVEEHWNLDSADGTYDDDSALIVPPGIEERLGGFNQVRFRV